MRDSIYKSPYIDIVVAELGVPKPNYGWEKVED